tara:strand:+ start:8551 stop:9984 length:1434 start_codon:yes stop_codon:yes gene_type:complete
MAVGNPDNSTSVLNPSVCVSGADAVGSRLSININQTTHGFTNGSVVRWNSGVDGHTAEYVSAKANSAYNAEVAGIVSQVTGADTFELTMAGSVNMTHWFDNQSGVIPAGITRDDVYFLSGYTAGWMDNVRPETSGWVAKPVITRLAEDDQGNIFGNVTNYVGSLLGGNVAVSLNNLIPVGTVQSYLGTNAPSGWSICDGDGSGGFKAYKGLPISEYPDYYNEVGIRYGWCEALKTDRTSWTIGSRIEQTVDGRTISGIITGVSADSVASNTQWIYVKQEYNNKIPNNGNFSINEEIDNGDSRGVEGQGATYDYTKTELKPFNNKTALVYDDPYETKSGSSFNILEETSGVSGVFSCLVPNFRGKFLMGADEANDKAGQSDPSELNQVSGNDKFSLNFEGDGAGNGINIGGKGYGWQHNLPPHITVNYIVRTNPNSYAALIDTLEIKNLRLTGLPTSASNQLQWTVYRDSGTLKIKTD